MKTLAALLLLAVSACTTAVPTLTVSTTSQSTPVPETSQAQSIHTPHPPTLSPPEPTASPSPPTSIPAAMNPAPEICSPLQGIPLASLPETISNPFHPPAAGSDNPHQGVDFADINEGNRIALEGRPVLAVLEGTVVAVISGRDPYGNALLIETPLERLPVSWVQQLGIPSPPLPAEIPAYHTPLSCPRLSNEVPGDANKVSLYLLYAHLQAPPALEPGDPVSCGQEVGVIGSSGNSLNPHLHLEVRYGPGGAGFAGMAHYDPAALPEEMDAYCIWRVSGVFPLRDPLALLFLTP
jgi:murein DD-endopeptidase MepM/ murein hydrolase activator NlpD